MICRHCQKSKANRPRGLCWACYYRAGVREGYQAMGDPKYNYRAGVDFFGRTALPDPTDAEPGSPEKIAILTERVRQRLSLHHPDDVMVEPASVPWTAPEVKFVGMRS